MLHGNVNPFDYFPQTTCHFIRGTCSTWEVFPDNRSKHLIKIFLGTVGFQGEREWLTAHAVIPFMFSLAFYGCSSFLRNFPYKGYICKITCYNIFAIISFALLPSSRFNLHVYFRLLWQTPIIEMPSLNRNEKFTCENCGTQITKLNLARHKKSCSVGTLYCTQCPNFSTKSQNDLNYHIAKKYSAAEPDITFKCKFCFQEFPGFYALCQHRNTQHGMQIGSGTRDVDAEHIVGYVEDHRLREELRSCQHFLVDSEPERARHKVFNYAVETPNETIVNEKLDHFFQQFE